MNRRRFKELNANLKSAGVTCAKTLNGDFLNVTLPFDDIDYILLDPSCSGSGIRNRNDDTETIDEERLERLSTLQIRMVTYALTNFPKVKRITYSTCSIHSQENEQVVETILDQFGDSFQVKKSFRFKISYKFFCFSLLIFYLNGQVVDKQKELEHVYVLHRRIH
jgi:putative methyltransferase